MADRANALASLKAKRLSKASTPTSNMSRSTSPAEVDTPQSPPPARTAATPAAPNVLVPASSPDHVAETPVKPTHERVLVPASSPLGSPSSAAVTGQASRFFANNGAATNGRPPGVAVARSGVGIGDFARHGSATAAGSTLRVNVANAAQQQPSSSSTISSPNSPHIPGTLVPERVRQMLGPPTITDEQFYSVMDRYPGSSNATIIRVLKAEQMASKSSSGSRPPVPVTASASASSPAPSTPNTSTFATSSSSPIAVSHRPVDPPKKISAIYQNRTQGGGGSSSFTPSKRKESVSGVADEEESFAPAPRPKKRIRTADDDEDSDGSDFEMMDGKRQGAEDVEDMDEERALQVFNTCTAADLTGTIACSEDQAAAIIDCRPFADVNELKKKLTKRKGVSFALFEQYIDIVQGYVQVDRCLNECEEIGRTISQVMEVWTGSAPTRPASTTGTATPSGTTNNDTGLHAVTVDPDALRARLQGESDPARKSILRKYIQQQPRLKEGVKLKDYQLVGLNWLNLLFERKISCILADEMGLGKTIQVISFFALLKQKGVAGPHLIVVPSSTLENWVREFEKFTTNISVVTYYGSMEERLELRRTFPSRAEDGELDVVLTTYDMAWKHDDQRFLRKKMSFVSCVFDEGHMLKNFLSQRYKSLIQIRPKWRLLLTGTPIQNNLQELVSLLNFIKEDVFEDAEEQLRQIFKVHSKGVANLLSQQRVSRARTMMTPFVLRRRKAQVLKDLPARTDRIEPCELSEAQKAIYEGILERSRAAMQKGEIEIDDEEAVPKPKAKRGQVPQRDDTSTNILMELRKAASHPLLFRRIYTDDVIAKMARACMKEPEFADSNLEYIKEDMAVMTDAELYHFCARYKSVNKHKISIDHFFSSGKVRKLVELLDESRAQDKRVLVFSQFTQILDLLEVVLKHKKYRFVRLDGSTKVDERQSLVDNFTEDKDIPVFLLSTKAGGMGINLVAASVVCIFDQDFNPHNDRQAADRAYRIGQTREVEVIKLITTDTIEEDIYRIGDTKLQLDDAVGGEGSMEDSGDGLDAKTSNEVKRTLMHDLRSKLEKTG